MRMETAYVVYDDGETPTILDIRTDGNEAMGICDAYGLRFEEIKINAISLPPKGMKAFKVSMRRDGTHWASTCGLTGVYGNPVERPSFKRTPVSFTVYSVLTGDVWAESIEEAWAMLDAKRLEMVENGEWPKDGVVPAFRND